MTLIKRLSLHEAQKIAAGEVIDRPAHCIKELVENSIDAQATYITIECEQAGKKLISVSDNGKGMEYEDLVIAYHRHTTSKITSCDDLQSLTTFGFRGEALASMCAVAQVVFVTKTEHDTQGTELIVENQEIMSEKPVARVTGTTVQVKNLFDMIPARKKFLKKDSTEWVQALAVIKAFIAQHISIHFLVKHDGNLIFNCPPVITYKDRLLQLYGGPVEYHVQEIGEYKQNGIIIEGALTDSQYGRFDKSGIYIFVNKRIVKNYHLVKALLNGYENSLQSSKFPAAIISITVDPLVIDVNVHPKKEEVLFQFPHHIDKAIIEAVKQTLRYKQSVTKSASTFKEDDYAPEVLSSAFLQHMSSQSSSFKIDNSPFLQEEAASLAVPVPEKVVQPESQVALPLKKEAVIYYKYLGIYNKTYIMVEDGQGLLMIDQHALHERLLYDQWTLHSESFETISLLFPITFSLLEEEYHMLKPYLQLFYQYGLYFEQLGSHTFRSTSVPVFLKNESIESVLKEVVKWIREEKNIESSTLYTKLTDKLRALIACKSAIKAGETIAEPMINFLLDSFYTSSCLTCPHGRPISWRLSLEEIEKKFKRDYR